MMCDIFKLCCASICSRCVHVIRSHIVISGILSITLLWFSENISFAHVYYRLCHKLVVK